MPSSLAIMVVVQCGRWSLTTHLNNIGVELVLYVGLAAGARLRLTTTVDGRCYQQHYIALRFATQIKKMICCGILFVWTFRPGWSSVCAFISAGRGSAPSTARGLYLRARARLLYIVRRQGTGYALWCLCCGLEYRLPGVQS